MSNFNYIPRGVTITEFNINPTDSETKSVVKILCCALWSTIIYQATIAIKFYTNTLCIGKLLIET